MEKVGEDQEKIMEEANSSEKTRSDKEDERSTVSELVDPLETIEESSMDPSNSNTIKDPEFNESDMEEEEEKVLEFFRRNSGLIHKVGERSNFSNLRLQEETFSETEQRNDSNEIEHLGEEIESSSDTEDSSSSSKLDSSLFRYYFDGSLPVSAHVQESETPAVPEDENKMPLLIPKRRVLQSTSWRNCCGLLQLLWTTDP